MGIDLPDCRVSLRSARTTWWDSENGEGQGFGRVLAKILDLTLSPGSRQGKAVIGFAVFYAKQISFICLFYFNSLTFLVFISLKKEVFGIKLV